MHLKRRPKNVCCPKNSTLLHHSLAYLKMQLKLDLYEQPNFILDFKKSVTKMCTCLYNRKHMSVRVVTSQLITEIQTLEHWASRALFSGSVGLLAWRDNIVCSWADMNITYVECCLLFLLDAVAKRAGVRIADRLNTETSVFVLSESARSGAKFVYTKTWPLSEKQHSSSWV